MVSTGGRTRPGALRRARALGWAEIGRDRHVAREFGAPAARSGGIGSSARGLADLDLYDVRIVEFDLEGTLSFAFKRTSGSSGRLVAHSVTSSNHAWDSNRVYAWLHEVAALRQAA